MDGCWQLSQELLMPHCAAPFAHAYSAYGNKGCFFFDVATPISSTLWVYNWVYDASRLSVVHHT